MEISRIYLLLFNEYKTILLIALGAVPGSLIRWQFNNDFFVNILGATVFGFLVGFPFRSSKKLIIGVGFCGALTTFSGWILDALKLLISGFFVQAFGLIFYTFSLGLLAAFFGFCIGRKVNPLRLFL